MSGTGESEGRLKQELQAIRNRLSGLESDADVHAAAVARGLRANAILRINRAVHRISESGCPMAEFLRRACDAITSGGIFESASVWLLDGRGELLGRASAPEGAPAPETEDFAEAAGQMESGTDAAGAPEWPGIASGRDVSVARGKGGAITIRATVEYGDSIRGLLTLRTNDPNAGGDEEIGLVRDLAGEIAEAVHMFGVVREREAAFQGLVESERQKRLMMEQSIFGIGIHEIILDDDGEPCDYRFLYLNPAFETLTGVSPEWAVGKTVKEVIPGIENEWIQKYGKVALTGEPISFVNYSSQLKRWYEVSAFSQGPGLFTVVFADVTERERALAAEKRLMRAYRVLSECNQRLVRESDPVALKQAFCDVIVEFGGYKLAMVGLREYDENKTIRIVAHAGLPAKFVESLDLTWGEGPKGEGPSATAIKTGKPFISHDLPNDTRIAPWRDIIEEFGLRALTALPLKSNGNLIGSLSIGAGEPDAFDDSEIALLKELAGDLAYGINMLRIRKEREEADFRYRMLFETSVSGFQLHEVLYDENGKPYDTQIIDVNPAFERILGLPREKAVGRRVTEIYPDAPANWFDVFADVAITGEPKYVENYWPPLDRWYHLLVFTPMPGHIAFNFVDITDKKRAEQAKERLLRAYRVLSLCNQQLVHETDSLSLKREFCRIIVEEGGYRLAWVGLKRDDANKTVQPVAWSGVEEGYLSKARISWADDEYGRGPTGTAIRTGRTQIARIEESPDYSPWRELALSRGYKSSIAIPLEWGGCVIGALNIYAAEPDAFDDEEVALLSELGKDLTYGIHSLRAHAEKAIAEERFAKLFESMTDGFALHKIIADENGRPVDSEFVDVNRAFETLTGLRREDVVGRRFTEVFPKSLPGWIERCGKVAQTGESDRFEEYSEALGKWFDFTIYRPEPGHYAVILADVSERKRAEDEKAKLSEQLRQSQKLESVGLLAGGIAHDFNNLLTPIMGYADLALSELAPDNQLYQDLEEIKRAGERAAALVAQLLAFSRKQVLEVKVLDIDVIVNECTRMLSRLIGENIELRVFPGADGARIKADVNQIHQILINLAANSRDAIEGNGTIIVETAVKHLDDEYAKSHAEVTPGEYVMLSFHDTGKGMDKEQIDRIFEPFYTTKELGKGTGLGLATVYGIVKQHGGHIWVYSEPGRGTTFKVYFPRVYESMEAFAPCLGDIKSVKGAETVLVVEDSDIVRSLAVEILKKNGYTVLEAGHPDAAIEIAKSHRGPIDLLLTDTILPKMDGRQLYGEISKARPSIKVLYTSGYSQNVIAHSGVLEQNVAFLPKPYSVTTLLGKVRLVLDT
ncbi:MAG: GAF domain-containing protein [bacterium]